MTIQWSDLEYRMDRGMVIFKFDDYSIMLKWMEQQKDGQFTVAERKLTNGENAWFYSTPIAPYWQEMTEDDAES